MGDIDLFCNIHKCRKRLNSVAWITSCNHAFCEEDGNKSFSNNSPGAHKCPACKTALYQKFDVVKMDLNPSQQFRTMVLAGLRPEIIFDISNRAISFWSYQIYSELLYQTSSYKHSQESLAEVEKYYESIVQKMKTDLQLQKQKETNLKKDLQKQKQRSDKLMGRLNEIQKELSSVKAAYERLRRSQLNYTSKFANSASPCPRHPRNATAEERSPYFIGPIPLQSVTLPTVSHNVIKTPVHEESSTEKSDFLFRPVTPSESVIKGWNNPLGKRYKK